MPSESLRLKRVVLALAAVTVVVVTVVVAALAFIGFLGGGIADLPELEALEDSEAADSEPSEAYVVESSRRTVHLEDTHPGLDIIRKVKLCEEDSYSNP